MLRLLAILLCSTAAVQSATYNGTGGRRVIFTVHPEKGGLATQLFALAHSLFVATAMGWDYELPEFLYSSDEELHRTSMARVLDVEQMQAAFHEQGTTLYAYGTSGPAHTIRFQNPPTSRPLCEWIQRGQAAVQPVFAQTDLPVRLVHFLPGARDVAVRRVDWRAFQAVVSKLYFAPNLVAIAQRIVDALEWEHTTFNAVHLPIEEDYTRHLALQDEAFHVSPCLYGTISCLEKLYFPIFREENSSVPYYVACSILSLPMEKKEDVLQHLRQLAPVWHYSTQFLTLEQGQELVYEQLAVVDLLVLAHSDLLVGMSWSTFTRFTLTYRSSKGLSGRERFANVVPAEVGLRV
eukprot:EG_transcript_7124